MHSVAQLAMIRTSLLAQEPYICQSLYNEEPLVIILIHINPDLKPRDSFLLGPLNFVIAIARSFSNVFSGLELL
jgi:hypothetical protein